MANERGARPAYRVCLATADGGPITVDGGLTLGAQQALGKIRSTDTLVVSGGNGHEHATRDLELVRQVRRLAATARRVASVCTGATVLAHTGLLNGRRVRRIRLEVAARLTCDTDLPLSGVARRAGFVSAETLRQAFVARYCVSPRDFRNRHQRAAAPPRPSGAA